jgi:hypothetical protein
VGLNGLVERCFRQGDEPYLHLYPHSSSGCPGIAFQGRGMPTPLAAADAPAATLRVRFSRAGGPARSAIDAAHTVSSRRLCCRHECGGGLSLFRNWGFSAEFARTVVNVRLQPCTPCLSGATDAAAPAAWRSSPSSAAPCRASADLVAERCDAATRPEWGDKRKCAGRA